MRDTKPVLIADQVRRRGDYPQMVDYIMVDHVMVDYVIVDRLVVDYVMVDYVWWIML